MVWYGSQLFFGGGKTQERRREEEVRGGEGFERTSFSILTLALIPSIWASFWFSSSESTASLYCPLDLPVPD